MAAILEHFCKIFLALDLEHDAIYGLNWESTGKTNCKFVTSRWQMEGAQL
jgi:hypothetical protein